jgi:phosphopantetheinyl transferase
MITASTLMRCKAPDLVDALLAKMYSTTSIAMDWLHNLQRQQLHLHQLQRQHQRQLPHQLRHQHRHLPLHLVQLQLLAIANK